MFGDSILAIATAPANGAIGILRLSGPDSLAALELGFRASDGSALGSHSARTLVHGTWVEAGEVFDEVMAVRFEEGRSATGEPACELHAHGGRLNMLALQTSILGQARSAGLALRLAGPGEFTQRALLRGRIDMSQAEAVADLVSARTSRQRAAAARQLQGGLARALEPVQTSLVSAAACLEAALDLEDAEEPELASVLGGLESASRALTALLGSAHRGLKLRQGMEVVLLGVPNAGKSTLFNAFAGRERALVHEEPGTTRDWLDLELDLEGWPVRIIDTAGLRTALGVEAQGIARGLEQARNADLVLALIDPQGDPSEQLAAVVGSCPGIPVWAVFSKADLGFAKTPLTTPCDRSFWVSAKTGEGLDPLRAALVDLAKTQMGQEGESWLVRERHLDALERCKAALAQARNALLHGATPDLVMVDLRESLEALGELTGLNAREDILEALFRDFCVGK